jgi:hypothetical protein
MGELCRIIWHLGSGIVWGVPLTPLFCDPANALRRFWRKSGARTTPSVMPSRYALRAVKAAPRVKRTFKGFELWFEKRESIT